MVKEYVQVCFTGIIIQESFDINIDLELYAYV